MVQTAADIFRRYQIPGVPASGPNRPVKDDIIAWGTWLENLLGAGAAGLAYATLGALSADNLHAANVTAIVYADPTAASNGLYVKAGASGSGSWSRIGDLPNAIVRLTYASGTANAIVASAPEVPQQPGNKIYLYTPVANNTAATTINGAAVTNALGSSLAANSLITDIPVLMAWQTDHYQILVSVPVDATGVLTDVIAARDAAAASAAALANQVHQYDTRAQAIAATIPVGVAAIKITRRSSGYAVVYASFIPGSSAGPDAFQEAGGHWWQLDLSASTILLPWFAKGDGSNDDTASVQAAYTAAAAAGTKRIDGMRLNYKITSTVTGASDVETLDATFTQAAHAAHPLFSEVDKTEWKFRRCKFVGDAATDLDYTSSQIGAILYGNSGSADQTGIAVEDCTFSLFTDNYIVNASITGTGGILNPRFKANKVYSNLGGNYVDVTRLWLSSFGTGSSAATTGRFFDMDISGNYIDADSLTIPIAPWAGHTRISIKNNIILNPGARSLFNPTVGTHNCYGMIGGYDTLGAAGNSTTCGQDGEISGNIILNPPSAGIYFATALNFNIHDNTIIGQSRTDDSSLPRAAISGNDLRKSRIHRNRLINCWAGVAVVSMTGGSDVTEVADNEIYGNSASDSQGVRVSAPVGTATANVIAVRRNTIRLTGSASRGLRSLSSSSAKFGGLILESNDIVSAFRGVDLGASFLVGRATIRGNRYDGVLSGGGLVINAISGLVIVQNETFDLASATGFGLNADSSTIQANLLQFNGKTSGSACITAVSALGTIEGVSFRGTSSSLRMFSGSLGYALPTISGTSGDFVQNVNDNFTEQGSAGSKYIVRGWSCSTGTTWLSHRELTGN